MGRTIEVTELILRDAHQSLLATRMAMEDMIPACEDLDNAGFWSLECWGGSNLRFLHSFPQRRSLGTAPHLSQVAAQNAPPDAASRSEPARLSSL